MPTFKAVVFKGEKHLKSDGTTNIKIKLYHNEQSQYIKTNFYINPDYMQKSGEVSDDYQGSDVLNYEIGELIQDYRKHAIRLGRRVNQMNCMDLKDYLLAVTEPEYEFIDICKFGNEMAAKHKKPKTAEWYSNSIVILQWFYKKEKIDVMDITSNKMNSLKKQLAEAGPKGKPCSRGTICNYLSGIRAIFNECKKNYNNDNHDIIRIPHEPFENVEVPKYKQRKKNICIDEIKKIRDGEFNTYRKELARDVFMMQFYLMGININDLYRLNPPVGGRVEYERSKETTDDSDNFPLSIRIEPELKVLFDKYSPNGFLSEIKKRYNCVYNFMKAVNHGLKDICKEKDIKKVTSNWSRHSWASIASNKAEVAVADVDFCLGHINREYKMARIYIEIDYSICDRANRKVIDLLLEKKPVILLDQTNYEQAS